MIILSVEIPDEHVDDVLAAFDKAYGYKPTRPGINAKGEQVEIEQTRLEFVENELATFIVNVTDAYTRDSAREAEIEAIASKLESQKDIKSSSEVAKADEIAVLEPAVLEVDALEEGEK